MKPKPIILQLDRDCALTLGAMLSIAQVVLAADGAPDFFEHDCDDDYFRVFKSALGVLMTKVDGNDPPSFDLLCERVNGMNQLTRTVLTRALEAA